MPRIVQCLAVAAMLTGSAVGANADTEADARRLAEIFCTLGKGDGQFGRMYLVTRSLTQLINDAQKKSDEIAAAQPDEKPPLGDGIPYQTFPDEAPVCAPGKLTDKGREQVIEITYSFPGMADASWTDRLVLIAEDGRLRIDDVWFGATDPADGLRKTLAEIVKPAQ